MMLLPNLGAFLTVVLGFLGLLFPKAVGRVLGIDLDRPLGTSEFRATYGGFSAVQARRGVEFVEAEVRKHSGERWNDLDIAMLFTGRLAPFRF